MKNDYLIIGAGIVGLALARELIAKYPTASIIVIEKEPDTAYHGSGRNSGVLHAGFYYTANSLKAKFTRDGNQELTTYCEQNNLLINKAHKVVVAANEKELAPLFELEKRGRANGVDVKIIDEKELATIDSNARTFRHALYSPTTSTVDPVQVCQAIKNELAGKGVKFYFNCMYKKNLGCNTIKTTLGNFSAGKIINAAGLYADRIAKDFNFGSDYVIIPFKGIYLKYSGNSRPVATNIYPVPNLKNPFLGVHFTITVDGTVKIGPTAIPAFWRENYKGIDNFRLNEFIQIMSWEAALFLKNSFGFRDLAFEEMKKYNKKYFVNLATHLVNTIDTVGFRDWSRPGIRAQLLHKKKLELVQDFVVEGDKNSVHVLNAVSPAFTGSFPFARWVVEKWVG